jgi:hypothetical protein
MSEPMVRFLDSDGNEQAVAPISLFKQIDSNARERDAQLLLQQVRALDATAKLELVRADCAIERARADAAQDAAHQLIASRLAQIRDSMLKLSHRMDSWERQRDKAKLDALPDPERQSDEGNLEPLPPSADRDREEMEARNNAEMAIAKDRGDAAPPLTISGSEGEPEPTLVLTHNDATIRRSDYMTRAAWKRAKRELYKGARK